MSGDARRKSVRTQRNTWALTPLTPEAEAACWRRRTPRNLWRIVMAYGRLARVWAQRIAATWPHAVLSDLEQAGLLGLYRAAEKFDPARGIRFSSYAWYHVRAAVRIEALAQSNLLGAGAALRGVDAPVALAPGLLAAVAACAPDLDAEELRDLLSTLPVRMRTMVMLRVGEGRYLREVAEMTGVSKEMVRLTVLEGLDRLRAEAARRALSGRCPGPGRRDAGRPPA